jgi:hypothetical protein
MNERSFPEITTAQAWVQVLAAAYELEPEDVVGDAILVANWHGSQRDLRATVRDRHGWHRSIPRYYVSAIYSGLTSHL